MKDLHVAKVAAIFPSARRPTLVIKDEKVEINDEEEEDVEVSIPGLGRICDPTYGKFEKVVWLIMLLFCTAACLYFTVDRLEEYFSYPTMMKMVVRRKEKIRFPTFSVCSTKLLFGLAILTKWKLEDMCQRQFPDYVNCTDDNFLSRINLTHVNLSLADVWNENNLSNVTVAAVKVSHPNLKYKQREVTNCEDCVLTQANSMLGSCVVVSHTQDIPYFSSATAVTISMFEEKLVTQENFRYIFIPHAEQEDHMHAFEFLNHEFEEIQRGYHTYLKIEEEGFELLNFSNRPCFEMVGEQTKVHNCVLDVLKTSSCRLPYLPEEFRECETLKDFEDSDGEEHYSKIKELREKCPLRKVCKEAVYRISIDYILRSEHGNQTSVTIKFSDDTSDYVVETLTYTFPALVSDLLAYWSFFLCLSALVFLEIFEYIIKKTCYWIIHLGFHKKLL